MKNKEKLKCWRGIDFTCLFKSDLSLKTNKDSLMKNLNRFDSYIKTEKSSSEPARIKSKQ